MKNILIIIASLLCFMTVASAQQERAHSRTERSGERSGEHRKKMEAQKIAFITNELDLTEEEAQSFWSVYNSYEKEMKTLRGDRGKRKSQDYGEKEEELTDEQANQLINKRIAMEEEKLNIKKAYISKFKAVLSSQKLLKLWQVENKFKKHVVGNYKKRMKDNKDGNKRQNIDKK